jgi:hypothetical protein
VSAGEGKGEKELEKWAAAGEEAGPVGRLGQNEGEVPFLFFFSFFSNSIKTNFSNFSSFQNFSNFFTKFYKLLDLTQATKNHA